MSAELRSEIDSLLADDMRDQAHVALARLFSQSPTISNAQFVLSRAPKAQSERPAQPLKAAFLRSFTVEPAVPLLRARARLAGIDLTVKVGEFNAYQQEILDPSSWLYEYQPNIVIIAALTRDLLPDLWSRFTRLDRQERENIEATGIKPLVSLFEAFRSRSQASLVVQNLETPALPGFGVLDSQMPGGQQEIISSLNAQLRAACRLHKGMYVLDYDGLVGRVGRETWTDERKWLTARSPIAADHLIAFADEYMKFVVPLSGKVCKALAIDLDNTLWGGVIGEDGIDGIKLGPEYPGAAFLALQQVILDLSRRGVILALCSKNNYADAMHAVEQHREMLLKPSDFAALRINWNDKAQSLREIAHELNIGIDSIAFIDDNPAERQRVQLELPEVTVIDLPEDPMLYAAALRKSPVFERLTLSAEDQERGRYYADQRQRQELESTSGSLEDFYRSLDMTAVFENVTSQNIQRIAQLTQKTNQFNTTTRRYTEQEIAAMADSTDWRVAAARVTDRFGDNGLVGVAILNLRGDVAEVDTFLMSCRVIGRTVETCILAHLMDIARSSGCLTLEGWFLPSKKNAPAASFYEQHGFMPRTETSEGILWSTSLSENATRCPEWLH